LLGFQYESLWPVSIRHFDFLASQQLAVASAMWFNAVSHLNRRQSRRSGELAFEAIFVPAHPAWAGNNQCSVAILVPDAVKSGNHPGLHETRQEPVQQPLWKGELQPIAVPGKATQGLLAIALPKRVISRHRRFSDPAGQARNGSQHNRQGAGVNYH